MDIFDMSEPAEKGLTYYNAHLKPILEPEQNGRALALHVDTHEYALADSVWKALQEMLKKYPKPEGRIWMTDIGMVFSDFEMRRFKPEYKL